MEQAFSYSLWDGCCAGAREECEKKAVTERNAMKWPQSLISPPMLLLCRKDVEVLEIKSDDVLKKFWGESVGLIFCLCFSLPKSILIVTELNSFSYIKSVLPVTVTG